MNGKVTQEHAAGAPVHLSEDTALRLAVALERVADALEGGSSFGHVLSCSEDADVAACIVGGPEYVRAQNKAKRRRPVNKASERAGR